MLQNKTNFDGIAYAKINIDSAKSKLQYKLGDIMSKTLLLSPEKSANQYANMPRGILTIDGSANILNGKLRTYNLTISPSETVVGIYFKGSVYKTTIRSVERGAYSFSISGNYADLTDIYFAFISKNQVVLCGGTYNDCIADIKEQIFDQKPPVAQPSVKDEKDYISVAEEDINDFFMQNDTKLRLDDIESSSASTDNVNVQADFTQTMPYMEMPLSDNAFETASGVYPIQNEAIEFAEQIVQDESAISNEAKDVENITTASDDDINNTSNENLNYADTVTKQQLTQDELKKENEQSVAGDFFSNIGDQLNELLANYPLDEELNAIVPDAKFVKIADNETGESYVLGVINQNGSPRYLAYGIPSSYDSEPPDSMRGKCQWLPTDLTDPLSDGYYIIYQDMQTGNLINIDIV